MDNFYVATLIDEKAEKVHIVVLYGFPQLQVFINSAPIWKYKLSIIQTDTVTNLSMFLNGEGLEQFGTILI